MTFNATALATFQKRLPVNIQGESAFQAAVGIVRLCQGDEASIDALFTGTHYTTQERLSLKIAAHQRQSSVLDPLIERLKFFGYVPGRKYTEPQITQMVAGVELQERLSAKLALKSLRAW